MKAAKAGGVYFNASQGAATNGVTGIFGKTCRIFVWQAQIGLNTLSVVSTVRVAAGLPAIPVTRRVSQAGLVPSQASQLPHLSVDTL